MRHSFTCTAVHLSTLVCISINSLAFVLQRRQELTLDMHIQVNDTLFLFGLSLAALFPY